MANSSFKNLSGGQKQRLSIALALVGNPRLAILDELTTGLDPQARREIWGLIESMRDRGVTVIPAFNGGPSYAGLVTMAVYTVIFGLIAIRYFRWE